METDPDIIKANLETADESLDKGSSPKVPREKIEPGLRTYASDIADMMKREKGSIIKIALAEQKRAQEFQKKMDPTTTKNIVVMILGLALIAGGIMIFIFSIMNRTRPVDITNTNSALPSFFFTEGQTHIDMTDLTRTELINRIQEQTKTETLLPKAINNLFISSSVNGGIAQVSSNVFLQKLGITIPLELFQSLQPSFMLGVYGTDTDDKSFLVFKVKDFNDTFLAMREWESTMLTELVRLFAIDTSSYGRTIFSKPFETATLFNKEARLLKDSSGKILISYIFLDPKTLMITTQPDALEEVIKRMNLQTIR